MTKLAHLLTAAALAALPFAAAAQTVAEEVPAISLGVDAGTVRVSTGGEFTELAPGQTLAPGQRVMVGEGSSATLTYPNGCQKRLVQPGVYLLDGLCDAAANQPQSVNTGMIVGIAAGAAAIAALAGGGGGGGDDRPPPVSR